MQKDQGKERGLSSYQNFGEELNKAGYSLWLASVGAVSMVVEEASDLFEHLVEKGEGFSEREKTFMEKSLNDTRDRVLRIGRRAEDRIGKQISGTLQRFGVPTRGEVQKLINRVEQLTHKVESVAQGD